MARKLSVPCELRRLNQGFVHSIPYSFWAGAKTGQQGFCLHTRTGISVTKRSCTPRIYKVERSEDTSTILFTQRWINSIATSHSKMGSVLKVWTKPRWKRRQRGWNWHTFQPTSLPPTMVRIIILKIDTGRVIIKYRPTKTNPKYFLPESCHLNGPI